MNRRRFLTNLAGAAVAATLPGCSLVPGLSAAAEPVTIHSAILPEVLPFNRGREARKVFEAWAEEYGTANPRTTVTLEELSYDDMISEDGRFAIEMLFGEDSDFDAVISQSGMLAQMIGQKLLAPADSFLQSSGASLGDDFLASLLQGVQREAQTWGIPLGFNPLIVRYNRSLFEQLSVPEPPVDWTWDQFLETCALLKAGLPQNQFALGVGPVDVLPLIYAMGGRIFDDVYSPRLLKLDEAATFDAISELASLMERGVLPGAELVEAYEPTGEDSETVQSVTMSVVGSEEGQGMADWQAMANYGMRLGVAAQNGDVAMWFSPVEEGQVMNVGSVRVQVRLSDGAGETGVALLPRQQRMVTLAETTAYSLVAASKHQKESWAWLEYVAGMVPPMGLPARRSLLMAPESASKLAGDAGVVAQALAEHLDEVDILPASAAMSTSPVAQALWRAWVGEPLDEALATAAQSLQAGLDEAAAAD